MDQAAAGAAGVQGAGLSLELLARFGIAAAIGLLVGLEREWAKAGDRPVFAGIRTFPSIALMGCTAAMISELHAQPWLFPAAFFGFALLVAISHYVSSSLPSYGTTTEITSLLVFLLGGLVFWGHMALAAALAVLVTLILSLKEPLHTLARRMEAQDIYATLKFAIVSVIVLPLLPNERLQIEGLELLGVLNPFNIWLLVVLVSGIGFLGYVAAKLLGARRGIALTGLLGGLASSTAVTASMAERSRENEQVAPQLALATVLACTVMFPRTIIEVAFVERELAFQVALPLLAAGAFGALASGYLWFHGARAEPEQLTIRNPFQLGPALKFGLLFCAMLLGGELARLHYREAGVLLFAAAGGLIDVRPIALTVADQMVRGTLPSSEAVAAVMIAALANTVLKAAYGIFLGRGRFRRLLVPTFGMLIGGGVLAVWFVLRFGPVWTH
ncbi:MAG: hypothetical protein KatS3mg102_1185 [Planctomycetota bacterium]|nr:MAG: hypothetical protein KatS3mg102_1185 [Planctomycetota bacterium]